MDVYSKISDLKAVEEPVHLAIGVFDGVHRGHQAVIRSALDAAAGDGGRAVVATFEPHPARVLAPHNAPRMLTSPVHQRLLLERLGVESLLVITFDQALASLTGEAFVQALAAGPRRLAGVHVGERWRFGRDRSGDVDLLVELGACKRFDVFPVKEVLISKRMVSSTALRQAIQQGDLDLASELLGRKPSVFGKVVKGQQLGAQLGFPTANVHVYNEQLPPNGVYAVEVTHGCADARYGVANLGVRPTVQPREVTQPSLEVHLFDFASELYGRELEISFAAYLRPERRFPGVSELMEQIAKDVEAARRLMV